MTPEPLYGLDDLIEVERGRFEIYGDLTGADQALLTETTRRKGELAKELNRLIETASTSAASASFMKPFVLGPDGKRPTPLPTLDQLEEAIAGLKRYAAARQVKPRRQGRKRR